MNSSVIDDIENIRDYYSQKMREDVIEELKKYISNDIFEFEDQRRNINVECCMCNAKPDFSLNIYGKFIPLYFCNYCRSMLLESIKIKETTVAMILDKLKDFESDNKIYRAICDDDDIYGNIPIHLSVYEIWCDKSGHCYNIKGQELREYITNMPKINSKTKYIVLNINNCTEDPFGECKESQSNFCNDKINNVGEFKELLQKYEDNTKILLYSNFASIHSGCGLDRKGEFRYTNFRLDTIYRNDKNTRFNDYLDDINNFENYYDSSDDENNISNFKKCLLLI